MNILFGERNPSAEMPTWVGLWARPGEPPEMFGGGQADGTATPDQLEEALRTEPLVRFDGCDLWWVLDTRLRLVRMVLFLEPREAPGSGHLITENSV